MTSLLLLAYGISRPRFWGYLAGPYIIGYVSGIQTQTEIINIFFFSHLFYFVTFANLLLYGVNDYFDMDTDQFNKKKTSHEHKLLLAEKRKLLLFLGISLFVSLVFFLLQTSLLSFVWFVLFIVLAIFYSAPPIRFKIRPFFDSASNMLYAVPAFLAYAQVTNQFPSFTVILSALCWTAAMHLFSAIPDIKPDKKAHITTTAVYLGENVSLIVCAFLWGITSLITLMTPLLFPWSIFVVIYPLVPLFLLHNKSLLEYVYWRFPYITMVLGMILFFILLSTKTHA